MIERPIIILGAPRSGTTILHRCLALHPDLWHLPGESHFILEGPFHPSRRGYGSNRVTAEDVTEEIAAHLRSRFYRSAINLNQIMADPSSLLAGNSLSERAVNKILVSMVGCLSAIKKPKSIRFLEKTPKNSLRIPMLDKLFPDALYIWIKREAARNINSLIAGWHAVDRFGPFTRQRFAGAGYPIAEQLALQDYPGKWWKFALVPGWREFKGKTLADVAVWQYYQCNWHVITDLANMDNKRVFSVRYEDFIKQSVTVIREICSWGGLPFSHLVENFTEVLPPVSVISPKRYGSKGNLRYANAVREALERFPEVAALQKKMGYVVTSQ